MSEQDARIAAVEDNLEYFFHRVVAEIAWLSDRSSPHVLAYSSAVAFPMFNLVMAARFGAATAGDLGRRVGDDFISRGLPWMWWTTPSHTSPELEESLTLIGLSKENLPGMHAKLDRLPESVDSVNVEMTDAADPDVVHVLIEGFDLPDPVDEPFRDVLAAFTEEEQVILIAHQNDRPVGVGTGLISDDTLGIYNVATLTGARGRGVGSAVTAGLMRAGRERGATQAILHASTMGQSVYERLGFEVVCSTATWVWWPSQE